jgi:hypothetical protein
MRIRLALLFTLVVVGLGRPAFAQYNEAAGENAPMVAVPKAVRGSDGVVHTTITRERPAADKFGNANGNGFDLAIDGAFEGQTVAVIQLYTGEGFDFSLPRAALQQKGFSVYRWSHAVPSPAELERGLAKSSQLWIISSDSQMLTPAHLAIIKKFFDAGHGVYIWGDNEPYYADANYVAEALFGTKMLGNVPGDQTVGVQKTPITAGVLPNHLLTTGLENIYEGITIATIQPNMMLHPLIYGSADNLVAAYYDHDGKRAILDGGFTRLYLKWDTAGTPRYVKNAASWLVNAERFGDSVIAIKTPAATPAKSIPAKPVAPAVTTVTPPSEASSFLANGTIGALLIGAMLALTMLLILPAWIRRS